MIDPTTHNRLRGAAAFCGVLYVVILFAGWGLVAGMMLPVWSPQWNTGQVAAAFQADTQRIRIGMLLTMVAAMLAIPFTASVSQQVARIEGHVGILTWCAGIGGAALMILTFYPAIFWLLAAYRPERADELIRLMNDLAWLQLIGGVTVFFTLPLSVALAALLDRSPEPLFPRWAGYYNLWTVLLIVPDQLLFFFKTGPFAWNGIFGFWIPVVVFGLWFIVTYYLLRRAINRTGYDQPVVSDSSPVAARAVWGTAP